MCENLLELPEELLEKIISLLPYDTIAQNRLVCKVFNELGAKMLNRGYTMAEKYHGKTLKAIKAKLPRRESERRVHPLARQCDILIAIETRLSMLSMTFTKWIDAGACCFIPGKVIDEIMRVLRCVVNNPDPPRAHELLQELRDISSMAMEHFDEKILPGLRISIRFCGHNACPNVNRGCSIPSHFKANRLCTDDLLFHKESVPSHSTNVTFDQFNSLSVREIRNRRKIKEMAATISRQGAEISELKKHVEEWEAKLRDIRENLIRAQEHPPNSTLVQPSEDINSRKRRAITPESGDPQKKIPKRRIRVESTLL